MRGVHEAVSAKQPRIGYGGVGERPTATHAPPILNSLRFTSANRPMFDIRVEAGQKGQFPGFGRSFRN
jgi:hypothetical protein